jgi:predicted RNA-binding protein Jag
MQENKIEKFKTFLFEEFEGATIDDAVKTAITNLKMSKDELKIKILTEGQPGLFGLKGEKPAKIHVSPKFNKVDTIIKFFLIKLLEFVKEYISFIDIKTENKTVNITIIFSDKFVLEKVLEKNVYNSIFILTQSFVEQILPQHKIVFNLNSSTSIPK